MVIVDTIVSIDGYAARPNGQIDWFLELRDVVEDVSWPELMPQVQAGLFGAQTYREFAAYWPTQSPAYDVNRIEKHVVSKSLPSAPWGTSASLRIHRDGVVQALEEVRSSTSGAVIVWGSLGVSRELFANDLVDELWLRVVPVSLGEGLQPLPRRDLPFDLVDCRRNEAGLLTLRYRVRGRP